MRTGRSPTTSRQTLPEVFPAFAPGNFTWDDQPRLLGVDDVQRVAVGRQLVEPRRLRRVRRHHRLPRQPGRRLHPPRRYRVRVEAPGHQLPEPARGARHHPGPAGLRADHDPRRDLQGRGDRRTEGRRRLPRPGRARRKGLRPRVPQLAHGPDLVGTGRTRRTPAGRGACLGSPRFPVTGAWATYLRCHDDIGWAIDDADAAEVGWNGYSHRAFLADFYAGDFPDSFARGVHFQTNAETGDRRTSGSAASLAGLEAGLASGDPAAIDEAMDRARLRLRHGVRLRWPAAALHG